MHFLFYEDLLYVIIKNQTTLMLCIQVYFNKNFLTNIFSVKRFNRFTNFIKV